MELTQVFDTRHSVRRYDDRPVEQEKLEAVLEAGRRAPTAANRQPQRFLVLRRPGDLARLAQAGNFHGAPAVLVVLGDHGKAWIRPQDGKDMVDIDTSIACTQMMLAAVDLGLGTCWLTWFDPKVIAQEFGLPEGLEPVSVLTLGYSAEKNPGPERFAAQRLPLGEMVRWDRWS